MPAARAPSLATGREIKLPGCQVATPGCQVATEGLPPGLQPRWPRPGGTPSLAPRPVRRAGAAVVATGHWGCPALGSPGEVGSGGPALVIPWALAALLPQQLRVRYPSLNKPRPS